MGVIKNWNWFENLEIKTSDDYVTDIHAKRVNSNKGLIVIKG